MNLNLIACLREQMEPLAALSLSHLTPATRKKLLDWLAKETRKRSRDGDHVGHLRDEQVAANA